MASQDPVHDPPARERSGRAGGLWSRSGRPPTSRILARFDGSRTGPAAFAPLPVEGAPAPDDAPAFEDEAPEDGAGTFDLTGLLAFALGLGLLLYWVAMLVTSKDRFSGRFSSITLLVVGILAGGLLYVGFQTLRRERAAPGPARAEPPAPRRAPATRPRPSSPRRAKASGRALARDAVFTLVVVGGVWIGLKLLLGTSVPVSVVPTESMVPALDPGDFIVVEGADTDALRAGDVIVFEVPPEFEDFSPSPVVHRIVETGRGDGGERWFQTKGDNNPTLDPYRVTPDLVVGKLKWTVPLVGHAILFLKSPLGLGAVFLAAAVGMALKGRVRPEGSS